MASTNPNKLRTLEKIQLPDPRHKAFKIITPDGQVRPKTLDDYYRMVNKIKLGESVPEEVQTQFEVVKNLFLYSWYVYNFSTVAELQAYSTLEFALRFKASTNNIDCKGKTLKPLIKFAAKNNWLGSFEKAKLNSLIESMPNLRNNLAHGGNTLSVPGRSLETINLCAECINQIFRR